MIEQLSIIDLPPSGNTPTELFNHHRMGVLAFKTCIGCGKEFKSTTRAEYCTMTCRRRQKKRRRIAKYGYRTDLYTQCACGNRMSRTSKVCITCKKKHAEESRQQKKQKQELERIKERVCLHCGKFFKIIYSIQKHCSDRCKQKFIRVNNPEAAKRWNKTANAKLASKPFGKVSHSIRSRVREALTFNRIFKSSKTFEMLGYTQDDLVNHLEQQFTFGMSWSNYGKEWHVDHIRPISSFRIKTQEDIARCWALKNLMPRWATNEISMRYGSFMEGNIEKSDKIY
jgi:hypothetical protein